MADISKININGNSYDINASYANSAGKIEGFSYMTAGKPAWGKLADSSYGPVCTFSAPGGSDGAFCYKDGQISMQVDGFLYQNEGQYKCIDEGSIGSQSVNYANSAGSMHEANLIWGGGNLAGSFGCIDAALSGRLGANRFAFGNPDGIRIEYSRDGGNTWHDYGFSNNQKRALFSTNLECGIGKNDSYNKATSAYMLRVTIDTDVFGLYTVLNKFIIYVSTEGSWGSYCTIDASIENTPDNWVRFADRAPLAGWSGYNVINTSPIVTFGNTASSQYGHIRFTFGCTGGGTEYNGLKIISIMGFGGVGWNVPSIMAGSDHLYTFDESQNAYFPASITSTSFKTSSGIELY